MTSEVAHRADFSAIRYAQVWEDAEVLVAGLAIRPGDRCLSIASAGDNAIAMLVSDPSEVLAVDLSPAQLACVALRVAAYRALAHGELLELTGSRASDRRRELYARCATHGGLDPDARMFWDARLELVDEGIGRVGKFERYFTTFRRWVLPLIHGRATVRSLLDPRDPDARRQFYDQTWDGWRWRGLFRVFFSRFVMGRLGRDPAFFRYVDGDVGGRILARAEHALVELAPADNPYLHWILTNEHGRALPLALRAEHFDVIRSRIDRLRWRHVAIEDALVDHPPFDRFNLSDIFEYMSPEASEGLLRALVRHASPEARLLYWNMLVPRSRPASMRATLVPCLDEAERLFRADKAFFYRRLVIEQVT